MFLSYPHCSNSHTLKLSNILTVSKNSPLNHLLLIPLLILTISAYTPSFLALITVPTVLDLLHVLVLPTLFYQSHPEAVEHLTYTQRVLIPLLILKEGAIDLTEHFYERNCFWSSAVLYFRLSGGHVAADAAVAEAARRPPPAGLSVQRK